MTFDDASAFGFRRKRSREAAKQVKNHQQISTALSVEFQLHDVFVIERDALTEGGEATFFHFHSLIVGRMRRAPSFRYLAGSALRVGRDVREEMIQGVWGMHRSSGLGSCYNEFLFFFCRRGRFRRDRRTDGRHNRRDRRRGRR